MVEDGTFLDQSERREVDIQKLLRELQVSGRIQRNIAGRLARGIRSHDSLDREVLMGTIRADGRLSCRP